ncbi:hypothetical protein MVES_000781 [Malassezia vespertilionis]|uniref:PUM-HD domain-containing protein n=1 Tax=Malassezia vespertilionis TaxID=2020962 RepID=A0A2N1JFF0_9BASI|nr:hypothetical protein MVES_000781 [Malassezia vespertilionis]
MSRILKPTLALDPFALESTPTTRFSMRRRTSYPQRPTLIQQLETRVQQLERRITDLEQVCNKSMSLSSDVSPFTPAKHANDQFPDFLRRQPTPDPFNPFWQEDAEMKEPTPLPGANAFSQALLLSRPAVSRVPSTPQQNIPVSPWSRCISPNSRNASTLPIRALVTRITKGYGKGASIELQRLLKEADASTRDQILLALPKALVSLALDQYGCYVVRRAMDMDKHIARHLQGSFVLLVLSPCGTLVVQHAVACEESMQLAVLDDLLHAKLSDTLTCCHAIPVWKKLFAVAWTDEGRRKCIANTIQQALHNEWLKVATTEPGSVAVQSMFEHGILDEGSAGMQALLLHFDSLAMDQWGVWILQQWIEHGSVTLRAQIAMHILFHVSSISLSVYGSKVVQCALRHCATPFVLQYAERLYRASPELHGKPAKLLLLDLSLTPQGLPILAHLLTASSDSARLCY